MCSVHFVDIFLASKKIVLYSAYSMCFQIKILTREMGGRFQREGTYVYLWLVFVVVWWKPTKFCKVIVLQLKNILKKKILTIHNLKHDLIVNGPRICHTE